jgi:RNA polymerase sigma factor (TIGR02999 family)
MTAVDSKPSSPPSELDQFLPLVYDELHEVARRALSLERPGHTLQPTALIHEVFLRLRRQETTLRNRGQFFALAARIIRRVLVDHAKGRVRQKRGGENQQVELEDHLALTHERSLEALSLHEALEKLCVVDPRMSRLVELRFFAGLSLDEAAEALERSPSKVRRDWSFARAWLRRELRGHE